MFCNFDLFISYRCYLHTFRIKKIYISKKDAVRLYPKEPNEFHGPLAVETIQTAYCAVLCCQWSCVFENVQNRKTQLVNRHFLKYYKHLRLLKYT